MQADQRFRLALRGARLIPGLVRASVSAACVFLVSLLAVPATAQDGQSVRRYKVPASGSVAPSAPVQVPPDPEGVAGILADVRRIVSAYESDGWFSDSNMYSEILPTMLQTVCRATQGARNGALKQLAARRPADPEQLYHRAGGELTDQVEQALTREREYQVLQRALSVADEECPFWVEPELAYPGRQTVRNQWAIHLEGGGLAQLRLADSKLALGGGGSGRLLLGRGLGDHWSLLGGLELGGGALLRSNSDGQFTINYIPAIPVVIRHRSQQWLYDLELAPVGLFQSHDTHISYGGRVGIMVGVSVLEAQGFLPWAGVAVLGEHLAPSGDRGAQQFIRAGLRLGFRWVP